MIDFTREMVTAVWDAQVALDYLHGARNRLLRLRESERTDVQPLIDALKVHCEQLTESLRGWPNSDKCRWILDGRAL